ncbi:MAG: choice-of-anchor D domain-containing protein [Marinoscillum sp.]
MKRLITLNLMILFSRICISQVVSTDMESISTTIVSGDSAIHKVIITNLTSEKLELKLKIAEEELITFTKENGASHTQVSAQDRISDHVWITRKNNQGIFNFVLENEFSEQSPEDTEWAFGTTNALSPNDYSTWLETVNYDPPTMIEEPMSLHLISEDRYFDITWHSWTCCNEGGGFSYSRREVVRWISINKGEVAIAANGSIELQVVLNASRINAQVLNQKIILSHDEEEILEIPITMSVTSGAGISTQTQLVNFGDQFINGDYHQKVVIENNGDTDLLISQASIDNDAFIISPTVAGIDPGTSKTFDVSFAPQLVQAYNATIAFDSNDPTDPKLTLPIMAAGVEPPVIGVSTQFIESELEAGKSETQSFTIENTGNSNLNFLIEAIDQGASNSIISFEKAADDPVDSESIFDVTKLETAITSENIFLKASNSHPYTLDEKEIVKESIILIDADRDQQTGIDVSEEYDLDLGVEYVILYDHSIESFILILMEGEDMIEQGLVSHDLNPDEGTITFELDRTIFDQPFNYGFLAYYGDADQVPDEGHLTFSFSPQWLDFNHLTGTIITGQELSIDALINATNLVGGEYQAQINILSNDPMAPAKLIDVSLSVYGTPSYASVEELDFGTSYAGISDSMVLEISNIGTDILEISDIASDVSQVDFSMDHLEVLPGHNKSIAVYITTESIGTFNAEMTFKTNDPNHAEVSITLISQIVESPVISLSSEKIQASISPGEKGSETLKIINTGGSDLEYSLELKSTRAVDLNYEYSSISFRNTYLLEPEDEVSVSLWVYLEEDPDCDATNNWRFLISKSLALYTYSGFDVILEEDRSLTWSIGTEDGLIRYGGGQLPIAEWTFLTFTYNGNSPEIFINAQKVNGEMIEIGGGPIVSNFYDLMLSTDAGFCQEFSGHFPGLVSEVQYWNVARSADQIKNDMYGTFDGNENGLLGYWPFDEGSGILSSNLTEDEYHAEFWGDVTWTEASPFSWFIFDSTEGIIAPDSEKTVTVTFDGAKLPEGEYFSRTIVSSNDPQKAKVLIDLELTIAEVLSSTGHTSPGIGVPYPNPLTEQSTIEYSLQEPSDIQVNIFNMQGQLVYQYQRESLNAGNHSFTWNGTDQQQHSVSNGLYLCQFNFINSTNTGRKLTRIFVNR